MNKEAPTITGIEKTDTGFSVHFEGMTVGVHKDQASNEEEAKKVAIETYTDVQNRDTGNHVDA